MTTDPFEDLRDELRRELPARVAAASDAALAAASRGGDRDHAITLSHRLRGTAGTLGFQAVSDAAAELEEALLAADETPGRAERIARAADALRASA